MVKLLLCSATLLFVGTVSPIPENYYDGYFFLGPESTSTSTTVKPTECVNTMPHKNCRKYYICDDGTKIEKECPFNMHFDPVRLFCDFPHRAGCLTPGAASEPEQSNNQTNSTPPDALKTSTTTDASKTSTTTDASKTSTTTNAPKMSTPKAPSTNAQCNEKAAPSCPSGDDVSLPHQNCRFYYRCKSGKPVETACLFDMFFDPRRKLCDFPHRVGCLTPECTT